jgi:hypothetical protein
MPIKPPKKRKSQQVHKPKEEKDLELIRQNIFNAKNEDQRRMWQNVLNKQLGIKNE